MRSLLLLLLALVSTAHAADTYQLEANGKYYSTVQAACDAAIPIVQAASTNLIVTGASAQSGGSGVRDVCVFNVTRKFDGRTFTNQGLSCGSSLCFVYRTACEAGSSTSMVWPIGPTDANNPSDILANPTCRQARSARPAAWPMSVR